MWKIFGGRLGKDDCRRSEQLLSAYLDNRLSARDKAEVDRHLRSCRSCSRELASLNMTVQALRRVPDVAPSRSFILPEPAPCLSGGWSPYPALRGTVAVIAVFLMLVFALDMAGVMDQPVPADSSSGSESGSMRALTPQDEEPAGGETNGDTWSSYLDSGDQEETSPGSAPTEETAPWVRPVEYSLLGLVLMVGAVTYLSRNGGRLAFSRVRKD